MGKNLQKILFTFTLLVFLSIAAFFTSCSQAAPELSIANYSVVFEYEDEESLPSSRLSLFMESTSDVNRYDRVKITAMENGFIWDFTDISKIILDNRQWVGNTNIVVPDTEIIPTGMYEVTYYNADEKETTVYVTVSYDTSIYDMSADEIDAFMIKNLATKKIAIYDKNNVLLYFDEKPAIYNSARGIWNDFRTAEYYYDIWCTSGDFVMSIMPKKQVSLEEEQ